jgi:hypothetical protein
MAVTRKTLLDPQYLSTTLSKIYGDVPIKTLAIIKHIAVMNVTAIPAEITIHVVPSGGTADSSNIAFQDDIAGGEPVPLYALFNEHIEAGGSLWGKCDTASAVSIRAGGIEDS